MWLRLQPFTKADNPSGRFMWRRWWVDISGTSSRLCMPGRAARSICSAKHLLTWYCMVGCIGLFMAGCPGVAAFGFVCPALFKATSSPILIQSQRTRGNAHLVELDGLRSWPLQALFLMFIICHSHNVPADECSAALSMVLCLSRCIRMQLKRSET